MVLVLLMQNYNKKKITNKKMAQVNLNVTELKGFVNHIITNNRFLQAQGKQSVSKRLLVNQELVKRQQLLN